MGNPTYSGNTKNFHNLNNNYMIVNSVYPVKNGYIGDKGQSTKRKNRQIICNNPIKEAIKLFEKLTLGCAVYKVKNKDVLCFQSKDGSFISLRLTTSTKDSPAVEINISASSNKKNKFKDQKIHFEKGDIQ